MGKHPKTLYQEFRELREAWLVCVMALANSLRIPALADWLNKLLTRSKG